MSAVVTPSGKLDAAEGDGTLEGDLDGRLFHAILPIEPGGSWDGTAAEVPLNCGGTEGELIRRAQKQRVVKSYDVHSLLVTQCSAGSSLFFIKP